MADNQHSPRYLVQQGARLHGDRLAIIAAEKKLTYQQLADRIAQLAETLKKNGISVGVQVALCLPNSIGYLVWYFAVLEAGAVIVPFAQSITPAEAEDLLVNSAMDHLVTAENSPLVHELGMQEVPDVYAEGASLFRHREENLLLGTVPGTDNGVLTRQFSSGSTGHPKHMLKTEANIAHDYQHFCKTLKLNRDERFLGVTPFNHSYGAMSFLAPFFLGGCVIVLPRFFPGPVIEAANLHRPTIFLATPPMIETLGSCMLNKGEEYAFRSLKVCLCSTGRLSKVDHDGFRDRFRIAVRIQYGSTETLSATVDLDYPFEENRVGRPYDGVEIAVFEQGGGVLGPEQTGQVGIRSPASCGGYVNDPLNSSRTFRNGFVFPGDQGYLDKQGRLHVLGRSDIINIGGYKVDRLEVETVIRDALPVSDVIVIEDTCNGLPVICAYVEADPALVNSSMVIKACREKLSSYKVPSLVKIRVKFERDANGKVLRSFLDDQ
jgi:long-chain acyl-CoA synthetase